MSALHPTLRSYEYWAHRYRRTWRGSVITSVVSPVLFLAAMGLGLGSLVDASAGGVEGVSYLAFVAPGLLAATAMQTAAGEGTYPIMGAVKWMRTYQAMLATPLRVDDVLLGTVCWIGTRIAITAATYLLVIAAFGAVVSPVGAVLALPAALLVGLAFATPIVAFAGRQDNDSGFATLFRFGIVPLFLFSGTFFPVDQLPGLLQPLAYVTPLWHGVALCRGLTLGTATLTGSALHAGYLAAWVAAGLWLARRTFRTRLVR